MEPAPSYVHESVLLDPVVALLAPRPGQEVLDGTLGGGGHSAALLARIAPTGRLWGVDRDPAALAAASRRLQGLGRFEVRHGTYEQVLREGDLPPLDGILLDLGVSSPQLDVAERGFSFGKPGPLDMRMDPTSGTTAADLVNAAEVRELERLIGTYGEERYAGRIARAIAEGRPFHTTDALADAIVKALPAAARHAPGIHPATRTFQALRIAVNGELGQLERTLPLAVERLKPGGRLAVISFHSLEDRIVKEAFRDLAKGCICPPRMPVCGCGRTAAGRVLTPRPLVADETELARNPRARSAKLRGFEKAAA